MNIFAVPLVLNEKNVVTKDKTSWLHMANQCGFIEIPPACKKVFWSDNKTESYSLIRDFGGKQEQRYHLHTPELNPDRHYGGEKYDRMKYLDTNCGRDMYSALNFHDHAMWMYNT